MPTGHVVSLQLKRGHWASLQPVPFVEATSRGLDGDKHAGREGGKRQVLLTDEEDLRELDLKPGDLREQVTLRLPGLMSLAPGTRVEVGEAVLEVTGPCEPCTHIGEHLGRVDPETFRRHLLGRRGMLARVAVPGRIEVGDAVRMGAT